MTSEMSKNPMQNMHTHFTDKKATFKRNPTNRQTLVQFNQNEFNINEEDNVKNQLALKNLIETANKQLNLMVNGPVFKRDYQTIIQVYIVFLKVGEIDNVKERFQADAYIEASWEDDSVDKTYDPKGLLILTLNFLNLCKSLINAKITIILNNN